MKAFAQVVFAPARNTQLCNPGDMVMELASATAAETKGVTESTYKNAESLTKLQDMIAEQSSPLDVVLEKKGKGKKKRKGEGGRG